MTLKIKKAFTLVELLISMLIMSILGGVVVSVLWMMFGLFTQTEDYTSARQEVEFAVRSISRQVANIGLGMPNNRQALGSFAEAFRGDGPSNNPIMASMGRIGEEWGGPVALGVISTDPFVFVDTLSAIENGAQGYHGPILYYAWAVPTGVLTEVNNMVPMRVTNGSHLALSILTVDSGDSGLTKLQNFFYAPEGRSLGITASTASKGNDPSSWIVFPSLGIPMLIRTINTANSSLSADVAPFSTLPLQGLAMGLEEVHLIQVARLHLDTATGELIQTVLGPRYNQNTNSGNIRNVLARNVLGLYFSFDPESRLLRMYIAAEGQNPDHAGKSSGTQALKWPSFATTPLPANTPSRYIVNEVVWKIRN